MGHVVEWPDGGWQNLIGRFDSVRDRCFLSLNKRYVALTH